MHALIAGLVQEIPPARGELAIPEKPLDTTGPIALSHSPNYIAYLLPWVHESIPDRSESSVGGGRWRFSGEHPSNFEEDLE